MKFRLIFLSIFYLFLIACTDNKTNTTTVDESQKQDIPITAKAIENFDYIEYGLSTSADTIAVNWEKYQELAIQVSYLKKADLSFFNGEKKILKEFIKEFMTTLPTEFKTNPIISRAAIIETSLLKLNESLTIDNIEGRTKLSNIKEVLEAFSNLNYQINKKLEREIYDKISKE